MEIKFKKANIEHKFKRGDLFKWCGEPRMIVRLEFGFAATSLDGVQGHTADSIDKLMEYYDTAVFIGRLEIIK